LNALFLGISFDQSRLVRGSQRLDTAWTLANDTAGPISQAPFYMESRDIATLKEVVNQL